MELSLEIDQIDHDINCYKLSTNMHSVDIKIPSSFASLNTPVKTGQGTPILYNNQTPHNQDSADKTKPILISKYTKLDLPSSFSVNNLEKVLSSHSPNTFSPSPNTFSPSPNTFSPSPNTSLSPHSPNIFSHFPNTSLNSQLPSSLLPRKDTKSSGHHLHTTNVFKGNSSPLIVSVSEPKILLSGKYLDSENINSENKISEINKKANYMFQEIWPKLQSIYSDSQISEPSNFLGLNWSNINSIQKVDEIINIQKRNPDMYMVENGGIAIWLNPLTQNNHELYSIEIRDQDFDNVQNISIIVRISLPIKSSTIKILSKLNLSAWTEGSTKILASESESLDHAILNLLLIKMYDSGQISLSEISNRRLEIIKLMHISSKHKTKILKILEDYLF